MEDDVDDEERRRCRYALLQTRRRANGTKRQRDPYTVVDLFCGCGGLSTGLEATGRFQTVVAVDIAVPALETFRLNHGDGPTIIQTDLGRLDPTVIRTELRKRGILKGDLDCLVGGPPCEGFSQNKVERSDRRSQYDFVALDSHSTRHWDGAELDPPHRRALRPARAERKDRRNSLFRVMLRVAEVTRPRIVLIENVRGILTYRRGSILREIRRTLERLGYVVDVQVLNAADYGVPQLRHRAFIVGLRRDVAAVVEPPGSFLPKPTHSAHVASGKLKDLVGDRGGHVTVWEAIGDLPLARTETGVRSRSVGYRTTATLSRYRRYIRRSSEITNHEERTVSDRVLRRLRAMKPGMRSHHLPSRLRTRKFYYNAYARLEWDRPANTITKSFVYLGSGKFGHPNENRGLTIREAARLQSFPDHFTFAGPSAKVVATMIGGAVPPLLAKAIGRRLGQILDRFAELTRAAASRQPRSRAFRRAATRRRISAHTFAMSARTRHSG